MTDWKNILHPHLRDRIKSFSEDDWDEIESLAEAMRMSDPSMSLMCSEMNAAIFISEEKLLKGYRLH